MTKYKACFVPSCQNNNKEQKQKIFLGVPQDYKRREMWFKSVNYTRARGARGSHRLYVCEDHFSLRKDAVNWMFYKTMGAHLVLKKHVVPHIFNRDTRKSQMSRAAKKRKAKVLAELQLNKCTRDQVPNSLPNEQQHKEQLSINSQQLALHTQTIPAILLSTDTILLLAEPQSQQINNYIEVRPDVEQQQFIEVHVMEDSDDNLGLHAETCTYNDDDREKGDQPSNTEPGNICQNVLSVTENANPDILIYNGEIKKETVSIDQDVLFTTVYIKEKYGRLETHTDTSICADTKIKTELEVEDQSSNTQASNSHQNNVSTGIDIKQEGDNVEMTNTKIEVKKEVDEQ